MVQTDAATRRAAATQFEKDCGEPIVQNTLVLSGAGEPAWGNKNLDMCLCHAVLRVDRAHVLAPSPSKKRAKVLLATTTGKSSSSSSSSSFGFLSVKPSCVRKRISVAPRRVQEPALAESVEKNHPGLAALGLV